MAKNKQPQGIKAGIYFKLPREVYHADPALSHSGMVDILSHPLDYWVNSPLNPRRKQFNQSEAMLFGDRCHSLLLEGDGFFKRFLVQGSREPQNNRVFLGKIEFDRIKEAVTRVRQVKMGDDHFKLGYPEVSIFWPHKSGIMLRARIDYLRTFGGIDYKLIRSIGNSTIGSAIADHGLDIQCALYCDGIRTIRKLIKQGKAVVEGDPHPEWLEEFVNEKDCLFRFFFQRSTPPYVWRLIKNLDAEIMAVAEGDMLTAIHIYKTYIEKYGAAEWPANDGTAEEFSIYNVPRRINDRSHQN